MLATWKPEDIELWFGQLSKEERAEVMESVQGSGSAPTVLLAALEKLYQTASL